MRRSPHGPVVVIDRGGSIDLRLILSAVDVRLTGVRHAAPAWIPVMAVPCLATILDRYRVLTNPLRISTRLPCVSHFDRRSRVVGPARHRRQDRGAGTPDRTRIGQRPRNGPATAGQASRGNTGGWVESMAARPGAGVSRAAARRTAPGIFATVGRIVHIAVARKPVCCGRIRFVENRVSRATPAWSGQAVTGARGSGAGRSSMAVDSGQQRQGRAAGVGDVLTRGRA